MSIQISGESCSEKAKRIRKEALTMPFGTSAIAAWKIRVLKQGYCGFLTYESGKLKKCMYCLLHNPYHCIYRVTGEHLLWEKLFDGKFKKRTVT